uniref:Uncharacterized protein n=2 Tax=Octactis speculum TaxID=3111310 RepID=A0A7S2CNB5_9STRA|mmetsp:Transcript_38081/g.51516  ORF Transcript_38081/g.51516 Transcript_38081/m.51516 type:complete len:292 (+) Transcript_38081:41-916(+)
MAKPTESMGLIEPVEVDHPDIDRETHAESVAVELKLSKHEDMEVPELCESNETNESIEVSEHTTSQDKHGELAAEDTSIIKINELSDVKKELALNQKEVDFYKAKCRRLTNEVETYKFKCQKLSQELEKSMNQHKGVVHQLMDRIRELTRSNEQVQGQTPRLNPQVKSDGRTKTNGRSNNRAQLRKVRAGSNNSGGKGALHSASWAAADVAECSKAPSSATENEQSSSPAAVVQSDALSDPVQLRSKITHKLRAAAMNNDRAALQAAITEAEKANLEHEACIGRRQLKRLG